MFAKIYKPLTKREREELQYLADVAADTGTFGIVKGIVAGNLQRAGLIQRVPMQHLHGYRITVEGHEALQSGEYQRETTVQNAIKKLEADRDNWKRIADGYGETIDAIQEVVGRFQNDTLLSVKELLQDYGLAQDKIQKLKADYAEMRRDLSHLYNLEGAEPGSNEDDTRQQILNKWK